MLEKIDEGAFEKNTLLKEVAFGNNYQFEWFKEHGMLSTLDKIALPEQMTIIPESFFKEYKFTEVHISKNISVIGNNTFEKCSNL